MSECILFRQEFLFLIQTPSLPASSLSSGPRPCFTMAPLADYEGGDITQAAIFLRADSSRKTGTWCLGRERAEAGAEKWSPSGEHEARCQMGPSPGEGGEREGVLRLHTFIFTLRGFVSNHAFGMKAVVGGSDG